MNLGVFGVCTSVWFYMNKNSLGRNVNPLTTSFSWRAGQDIYTNITWSAALSFAGILILWSVCFV